MRKTWLFILLLICVGSGAQTAKTEVYALAGLNTSEMLLKTSKSSSSATTGRFQWQAGASVWMPIEKSLFLYTGIQYENKSGHAEIQACCTGIPGENFDYTTQHINVPLGLAYQWLIQKTKLRFGAGAFVAIATGGFMKGNDYSRGVISFSSTFPYRRPYRERSLAVGNGPDYDLRMVTTGLQANVTAILKKLVLQLQYQFGLSRFNPDPDFRLYFNTVSVNVGYKINRW